MDQTTQIINRVLPILLLIGLGYWIRRRSFLPEATVDDLKKMAANLALPAVLFLTFLEIDLQANYLGLIVLTFGLCVALYGLGVGLQRVLNVRHAYFPFLMTGFEFGMLGFSLFGSAYGLENFHYIAITDLGHELFIWFVFLALLLMRRDGLRGPGELVRGFLSSPVILAILLGLAGNALGLAENLGTWPVTGGIVAALAFLRDLTIPLILIIVGYGIKLDRHGLREAALVIGVRLALLIPLALIFNAVIVRGLLGLERGFEVALFVLLVLPPPFIVPLYMRGDEDEKRYVNNVLTLYTVVTIIIFSLVFIFTPPL
ncbi:MAG: hypothetical protein JW910_10645 [Anaerolineae bacterium]|nr:hypothetical protein [Anaerolineae bacterium]